jgi:mannose-6-phosphate isomerase-like protein (cupin superfamily)
MKIRIRDRVTLRPDRMARVALAATERALVDLYCLAPGQEQKPHAHDDQDKIYVILEGRGRVVVDGTVEAVEAGDAVVARAGRDHGLLNDGDAPLLAVVVVTPPPPHSG